jgi:hypothetical protein
MMQPLRRLTLTAALAAVLSFSLAGARAQQQPTAPAASVAAAEQHVRDVEALRLKAFLDHGVKTMATLLADDMIHTTSNGKTRNKTEFMDDFVHRPTAFSQFVTDDMEVIVIGDAAVTRGGYHNLVQQRAYGTALKHARFLRVWAKRDGAWVLLSHQATEIAPPPK